MSVDALLARGRAAAERLMTDTCVIRRVTGTTTNPANGQVTPTYATVYSGRCRLQQAAPTAQDKTAGEAQREMVSRVLQLPVLTSAGVLAGDEATITECVQDPDMDERMLKVRGQHGKSQATMRRLLVEEATS
jgi:hypothetical protein